MSYEATEWSDGDIITAQKLNKLENGVVNAGSGGILVVTGSHDGNVSTLDHTFDEIYSAAQTGIVILKDVIDEGPQWYPSIEISPFSRAYYDTYFDTYTVVFSVGGNGVDFYTSSPDGYPIHENVM